MSKLRPGRINSFDQFVDEKKATRNFNISIVDLIPEAKIMLKKFDIYGAEEYNKLQTMNITYKDKLLGYCACCILGEAAALKRLIEMASALYQPDEKLRKQSECLLNIFALAKYPLKATDRYSAEYYMLLADLHLGVFGKWKHMSYDRAKGVLCFVCANYPQCSDIAEAKLCCCKILSSTAQFPCGSSDLRKLDEFAQRYEFCALTALVFCLSPELPDKKERKAYRKRALTYLSLLKDSDLVCFIELLNYISEKELLGDVNQKRKKAVRKFSANRLSDTNWYGLMD